MSHWLHVAVVVLIQERPAPEAPAKPVLSPVPWELAGEGRYLKVLEMPLER
jgi:hypothetical protein